MARIVRPDGVVADVRILDYSSPYYDTDYSEAQIDEYLSLRQVKASVKRGSFRIDVPAGEGASERRASRQKNRDFMRTYGLHSREEQARFLCGLSARGFCHVIRGSADERLYVFCADRCLYKAAHGYERVLVYVKQDHVPGRATEDVVVSLHKLEKPIVLVFEE